MKTLFYTLSMKQSVRLLAVLIAIPCIFQSCSDDSSTPSKNNGPIPQITEVKFVSQTKAEIHYEGADGAVTAVATGNHFGESTSSPVSVNVPKGKMYRFAIASGTESSSNTGEYSDSSDLYLASTNPELELDRKAMLSLINKARATSRSCGGEQMDAVPPLAWDDRLEKAALVHTKDMDDNNFMAHDSPTNGSTPPQRIKNQNYNWAQWGENVGRDFKTQAEAVIWWIQSPPHCKNIMSPNVTEFGAAKVDNYYTQVFGREK